MVIGMICFLMAIGSMLRPRWLPQKSFPPYAYSKTSPSALIGPSKVFAAVKDNAL